MFDQEPASRISLPPVPDDLAGAQVAAWSEPLIIDSYLPEQPDGYPAFLDSRVYQGSSGKVFPLPFHERVSSVKVPHVWQAIHLENEWVRVVVLPELGGRIHIGYDKVAGYDFFYRNNVIKPALVGLAGPWISGGVEFNWPQHHRPATFLPTDFEIEREEDRSVTVWCSDHEPFARMKGMHGIRLRPDSSLIEARVRLYNRSDLPQTFLWWANVAAAVGPHYQSFFPSDVSFVADHARRAVTAFPAADRHYYGIDYPALRTEDRPNADYIDWYDNIPVPTSYMVTDTDGEFFGGYDHEIDAGFVHWAPREISPGKKQWTWGNSPFGWAWDANLTDDDGPYVELMAGVYTDNQPDFAWLGVGETKSFSQYWYPIRGISGPATHACRQLAARFEVADTHSSLHLVSSEHVSAAQVTFLDVDGHALAGETVDLNPGSALAARHEHRAAGFRIDVGGVTVLRGSLDQDREPQEPRIAQEPPIPADVAHIEELVFIAQYLQQYRHATSSPEPYWREALRRDPHDTRSLTALGSLALSRGQYRTATSHLRLALERQTFWAHTQRDGEAGYLLGLALDRLGLRSAIAALARAAWSDAWWLPARFALARIQARDGKMEGAIETLTSLVASRPDHLQSRNLLSALYARQGRVAEARSLLEETLQLDPLDQWARLLAGRNCTSDAPTLLDVALEFAAAGLLTEGLRALDLAERAVSMTPVGQVCVEPLIYYHRAVLLEHCGRAEDAKLARSAARNSSLIHCQASRLDDADALEAALAADPDDTSAALLLGNWLYDKSRGAEAVRFWKVAANDDRAAVRAIALRNLGVAAYNLDGEGELARDYYLRALAEAPHDAKVLYELDQLRMRLGDSAADRLAELDRSVDVVAARDDLTVVRALLLVEAGREREAWELMSSRHFQPWEGGEGRVLSAWDEVQLARARRAIKMGDSHGAESAIGQALAPPVHLGEARHPLANAAELHLVLGDARSVHGDTLGAKLAWMTAAAFSGDFSGMTTNEFSVQTVHSVSALCRLDRRNEARALYKELMHWLEEFSLKPARRDFFATSLPSILLFVTDPNDERDAIVDAIRQRLVKIPEVSQMQSQELKDNSAL